MSKKQNIKKDDEEIIFEKARYIIGLENIIKDPTDASYIQCIKYIFTKNFTQGTIEFPLEKIEVKTNKAGIQYLKNFVNIIYLLFQKNEKERNDLYYKGISVKEIGAGIYDSFQNLKKLVMKEKVSQFNLKELKGQTNFLFANYLNTMSNFVSGSLNLYFFYLGFFIQSISSFNFMLFYFLRLSDLFKTFEFKDFCPDLNSNNCLNLIHLLFKNIEKKSIEILSIYSLLIFKYKSIFYNIKDNIKDSILEMSVLQTNSIVKEKTLKNNIIFLYIIEEFKENLQSNIRDEEESLNGETNMSEKIQKDNNIQGETENINNINTIINDKESNVINEGENNNNLINKEKKIISNNNEIGKKHTKDDSINNPEKKICDNTPKIDDNNNKNDGNEITTAINKGEEINNSNIMKEEENALIIKLQNDIKDLKEKYDAKFLAMENEIRDVKKKLKNVRATLSNVQMRDGAKNILRYYENLLDKDDKKKIEKNKNKKWELIAKKIEKNYEGINTQKNKTFIEIVKKCADKIYKGNANAHHIELEHYEVNLNKIIGFRNKNLINHVKICFLLEINLEEALLMDGYDILNQFYEDNMERAFTKGISFDDYLQLS